jgi:hypothetical protein
VAEPTPAWIAVPSLVIVTIIVSCNRELSHPAYGNSLRQRLIAIAD